MSLRDGVDEPDPDAMRPAAGPLRARVPEGASLPQALEEAGLTLGRPVLACVGGAGGMSAQVLSASARLLEQLCRAVDARSGAVVDGGTDTGVMRLTGQARRATGGRFPLVGVVAEGTVATSDGDEQAGRARLEPHHTHALLVPGTRWGDEAPWLSRTAGALAAGAPAATLVVNGGQITYRDVELSLEAHRPVVVVAGTGRTADEIAGARRGTGDDRAGRIARHPLTTVCADDDVLRAVAALLDEDRRG